MKDSLIIRYIEKLKETYTVNEINFDESIFITTYHINPCKWFAPKFIIGFFKYKWEDNQDEKFLNMLDNSNKAKNDYKPVPWIIFVSSDVSKKNLLYFNGHMYVHIVMVDEMQNKVFYDNNFLYYGANNIRNAIKIFNSLL